MIVIIVLTQLWAGISENIIVCVTVARFYSAVDCQLPKLDPWKNLAMDLLFTAH